MSHSVRSTCEETPHSWVTAPSRHDLYLSTVNPLGYTHPTLFFITETESISSCVSTQPRCYRMGVHLMRHTQSDTERFKRSDRLEEAGHRAWARTLTAEMDLDSVQTARRANCQSHYTANEEFSKYQLIKSNWLYSLKLAPHHRLCFCFCATIIQRWGNDCFWTWLWDLQSFRHTQAGRVTNTDAKTCSVSEPEGSELQCD